MEKEKVDGQLPPKGWKEVQRVEKPDGTLYQKFEPIRRKPKNKKGNK